MKKIEKILCLILAIVTYYIINYKFMSLILVNLGIRSTVIYVSLLVMGIMFTYVFLFFF